MENRHNKIPVTNKILPTSSVLNRIKQILYNLITVASSFQKNTINVDFNTRFEAQRGNTQPG